jgi:hypothetical protein
MSVTHALAFRTSMASLCNTAIGTSGRLVFRVGGTVDSVGAAAANLALSANAGTTANGVLTFGAITSDTNCTGNASAVSTATLQAANGVIVCQGNVTASSGDFNMSGGLTIGAGDTVSCSALTYTAPV